MASNKVLNPFFSWGDAVTVNQTAPNCYKPGCQGSICGFRTIDSDAIAVQFNQKIGSVLCLVEFLNGETLEIPKCFLNHPIEIQ